MEMGADAVLEVNTANCGCGGGMQAHGDGLQVAVEADVPL